MRSITFHAVTFNGSSILPSKPRPSTLRAKTAPLYSNKENTGPSRPIDAFRIDVLKVQSGDAETWMQQLPKYIVKPSSAPNDVKDGSLLLHMFDALHPTRPQKLDGHKGHASAREGHFEKLLLLTDNSGIVTWSLVSSEDPEYGGIVDKLTMSLFVVQKIATRDRMISWPCVQNRILPDTPYFELPTPYASLHIRLSAGSAFQAIYTYVANTIHNIRLPPISAPCFECLQSPRRTSSGRSNRD